MPDMPLSLCVRVRTAWVRQQTDGRGTSTQARISDRDRTLSALYHDNVYVTVHTSPLRKPMKNTTTHTVRSLMLAACLVQLLAAHAQSMQPPIASPTTQTIANELKVDMVACDVLAGNAKDICSARAKGRQKVARAEMEVHQNPGAKSTQQLSLAKADAAYAEAIERCDDKAGNEKDICVTEAKSAHTSARADANAQRKTADANADAHKTTDKANAKAAEKVSDARQDATAEKRESQYKVAKEKCDALSSDAKDACLTKAKTSFGSL